MCAQASCQIYSNQYLAQPPPLGHLIQHTPAKSERMQPLCWVTTLGDVAAFSPTADHVFQVCLAKRPDMPFFLPKGFIKTSSFFSTSNSVKWTQVDYYQNLYLSAVKPESIHKYLLQYFQRGLAYILLTVGRLKATMQWTDIQSRLYYYLCFSCCWLWRNVTVCSKATFVQSPVNVQDIDWSIWLILIRRPTFIINLFNIFILIWQETWLAALTQLTLLNVRFQQ